MISRIEFAVTVIVLLLLWFAWSFRDKTWSETIKYFKTKTGLGILKGIVLATLFTLVMMMLPGCGGKFVNDASVYAGLDHTKKDSPMCEEDGADPHTTSNIGLMLNLYESQDSRFRTNTKYTHHSCAFNEDDRSYDAIGIEATYKFWER